MDRRARYAGFIGRARCRADPAADAVRQQRHPIAPCAERLFQLQVARVEAPHETQRDQRHARSPRIALSAATTSTHSASGWRQRLLAQHRLPGADRGNDQFAWVESWRRSPRRRPRHRRSARAALPVAPAPGNPSAASCARDEVDVGDQADLGPGHHAVQGVRVIGAHDAAHRSRPTRERSSEGHPGSARRLGHRVQRRARCAPRRPGWRRAAGRRRSTAGSGTPR